MKNEQYSQADEAAMQRLREILLNDDRAEVNRLRELLDDEEKLFEHLQPVLERRVDLLKQNFPKEYTKVVERLIDQKIQSSQKEIVEAISPFLGQLIKKYIDHQFQLLKDSIDAQISATRKKLDFWGHLKARFSKNGPADSDLLLAAVAAKTQLNELFLIEKDSGLLISHAVREEVFAPEAVAGMLTAIRSFAEDAFQRGSEKLAFIEHSKTKIVLFDQPTVYMAAILQGNVSLRERLELQNLLQEFLAARSTELKKRHKENDFGERFGKEMSRLFLLSDG